MADKRLTALFYSLQYYHKNGGTETHFTITKSFLPVPVRSLERTLNTPSLPRDTALLLAKQNLHVKEW